MSYDQHKNFAYSTVLTAPSPASSGTSLVVSSGDGTKFPAVPFNATVWPVATQPLTTNSEIVRVTAISTDTLTITRAQESTSARAIVVGDQIAASITAKTLTDIEAYALQTGAVVQAVDTQDSAVHTGTTTIPLDDTIPQNTEGDEYTAINTTITPRATTNKLYIDVTVHVSNSVAGECIMALFQDSGANALMVDSQYDDTGTGRRTLHIQYEMAAGTTSATTFKVRVGGDTAGTRTINGFSSARKFGGVYYSSLQIIEVSA